MKEVELAKAGNVSFTPSLWNPSYNHLSNSLQKFKPAEAGIDFSFQLLQQAQLRLFFAALMPKLDGLEVITIEY